LHFSKEYKINKHKDMLMGNNSGLRSKEKEGETQGYQNSFKAPS
jgi:hypothetical protein